MATEANDNRVIYTLCDKMNITDKLAETLCNLKDYYDWPLSFVIQLLLFGEEIIVAWWEAHTNNKQNSLVISLCDNRILTITGLMDNDVRSMEVDLETGIRTEDIGKIPPATVVGYNVNVALRTMGAPNVVHMQV